MQNKAIRILLNLAADTDKLVSLLPFDDMVYRESRLREGGHRRRGERTRVGFLDLLELLLRFIHAYFIA